MPCREALDRPCHGSPGSDGSSDRSERVPVGPTPGYPSSLGTSPSTSSGKADASESSTVPVGGAPTITQVWTSSSVSFTTRRTGSGPTRTTPPHGTSYRSPSTGSGHRTARRTVLPVVRARGDALARSERDDVHPRVRDSPARRCPSGDRRRPCRTARVDVRGRDDTEVAHGRGGRVDNSSGFAVTPARRRAGATGQPQRIKNGYCCVEVSREASKVSREASRWRRPSAGTSGSQTTDETDRTVRSRRPRCNHVVSGIGYVY